MESSLIDNVVDHDDALWRVALLRLLPPGRLAQHADCPLSRQLVLNEAQLLILLKLVLEFLKLEILLREFLCAAKGGHVGLPWPCLVRALLASEVRGELLGRAHVHSEALAAVTAGLPVGGTFGLLRMWPWRSVAVRVH